MSIKIAITNEKGGCGKTTSAVNISAILAERGYRVLLADVDPQSYATMYYGLYNTDDPSLYDAITGVWPVNDAIVKTVFGVDVLKSNTKLMKLEEKVIHNDPQLQPEPEPETKSNPISNPGGFWS